MGATNKAQMSGEDFKIPRLCGKTKTRGINAVFGGPFNKITIFRPHDTYLNFSPGSVTDLFK